MSSATRISIGFKGGQVLALRVPEDQLSALQGALGSGGWQELQTEDGPVRVDLGQVIYVQAESKEQSVGFGT
jgi:hypothetical protein